MGSSHLLPMLFSLRWKHDHGLAQRGYVTETQDPDLEPRAAWRGLAVPESDSGDRVSGRGKPSRKGCAPTTATNGSLAGEAAKAQGPCERPREVRRYSPQNLPQPWQPRSCSFSLLDPPPQSRGDGFRKDFLHENGISTRHRRIDWREVGDSLGTEEYSKNTSIIVNWMASEVEPM
ncbi:uncharacterized protein AAG666_003494 [Megaptera novaeangliae]